MAKLIGAFAAAAAATAAGFVVVFRRKRKGKNPSRWQAAKSSAVSWSRTAAHGASTAADRVAGRA
jgi:hypothetical protein